MDSITEYLLVLLFLGWNVTFRFQPANSPDLNVLDLGFFRSIQTLQYECESNSIDELIAAVEAAYVSVPNQTLDNVFVTLQSVMLEVMVYRGGNRFKIPHLKKASLSCQPISLPVLPQLYSGCCDFVTETNLSGVLGSIQL